MQDTESSREPAAAEMAAAEKTGLAEPAGAGPDSHEAVPAPKAGPRVWLSGRGGLLAWAAAGVLIAGIALGSLAAAGGVLGAKKPSSVIPSPPRANATFVEDDDGTGADNQANILASTAPGLVSIASRHGTPRGLGVMLTPSGIVMTSDQVLQGARAVTVRIVLSGRAHSARVIGSDAAQDLALLQVEGGPVFKTVAIGTSRDLTVGTTDTAVGSNGIPRTFTLDLGNLSSLHAAAAIAGHRLPGLLESTSQGGPGQETGGPLVNLSGQVVGIDVARAGRGLRSTVFAVPVNQALAIAQRIAG